jgi:rhodanese-related sulfurtransferase
MLTTSTLRDLPFEEAEEHARAGAAFVDLREVKAYLDAHIRGSLSLQYERGPGFQSRARDCIPLDVPLLLLERPGVDMLRAAASLRGRGFEVVGQLRNGLQQWGRAHGAPASTDDYQGPPPRDATIVDVQDPGAHPVENATVIPLAQLWDRSSELALDLRVVIVAGYGVRAALGVGILERAGATNIVFWTTRG